MESRDWINFNRLNIKFNGVYKFDDEYQNVEQLHKARLHSLDVDDLETKMQEALANSDYPEVERLNELKKQVIASSQEKTVVSDVDECEIESIGEVVPTPVVMDDIDFSKASDDIVENAAEQGIVKAQIELSDRYYDMNNYRKAFEWAKKAAESGEPEAQATLATYYKLSIGTCEYPQKVFELHMQAAEQGYAESQYAVGELYYSGYSVQKNINIAFQWFEKAANQGHQDALFVLATVDDFNNRISNQKRRKI